ncbi:hypothetical protein SLE2022_125510 [Rubroshorea leprosula]
MRRNINSLKQYYKLNGQKMVRKSCCGYSSATTPKKESVSPTKKEEDEKRDIKNALWPFPVPQMSLKLERQRRRSQ